MKVLGIDPGPSHSGWALYDMDAGKLLESGEGSEEMILALLDRSADAKPVVVSERVQSYGIPGNSLLETAEVYGSFRRAAIDSGHVFHGLYRRQVLSALDVAGKGNRDAMIRERLMEMHGGTTAKGTKKAPGPLYGLSGHAWQALAVALAWWAMGRRA